VLPPLKRVIGTNYSAQKQNVFALDLTTGIILYQTLDGINNLTRHRTKTNLNEVP